MYVEGVTDEVGVIKLVTPIPFEISDSTPIIYQYILFLENIADRRSKNRRFIRCWMIWSRSVMELKIVMAGSHERYFSWIYLRVSHTYIACIGPNDTSMTKKIHQLLDHLKLAPYIAERSQKFHDLHRRGLKVSFSNAIACRRQPLMLLT